MQANPCLYDRRDKNYKNAIAKTAIWTHIAYELDMENMEECLMKKWLYLRDRYRRQKAKQRKSRGEYRFLSNWQYQKSMAFLDAKTTERPSDSNFEIIENQLLEMECKYSNISINIFIVGSLKISANFPEHLVEKLISLVRANPSLYDKKEKGYKNAVEKSLIWTHIANELGMKGKEEFIMRKWLSLRERHKREMIKIRRYGSDHSNSCDWPYQNNMAFLEAKNTDTLTESLPESSTEPLTETLDIINYDMIEEIIEEDIFYCDDTEIGSSVSTCTPLKRAKVDSTESESTGFSDDLQIEPQVEQKSDKKSPEDEFGGVIAGLLKQMNGQILKSAKSELLQVVTKYFELQQATESEEFSNTGLS